MGPTRRWVPSMMVDVIAAITIVDIVLDCYVVSFLGHWMHLHGGGFLYLIFLVFVV